MAVEATRDFRPTERGQGMDIKMVSLEDGITSCGFRKMSASVRRLNPTTQAYYVTTSKYRSLRTALLGALGAGGEFPDEDVDGVARGLVGADLIGFSSMTGYADLTKRIATRVRELDPNVFMIWGGIHPIIHPEDAITADVDAICTGEGEFAFEEFLSLFRSGRDYTGVSNFWFRTNGDVVRNGFLPLMTAADMDRLPFPQYGEGEMIYRSGEGFAPMRVRDYLANDGLGYTTLWSIGCPFHCTYCGNTKFIENDPAYKKIRHPSARYIVDEVLAARKRFPHLSSVSFHDDSFMAIPYRELESFAELWKADLDIPFAVYGVIPNYVDRDKYELLTWAGMNRIRMGIQSGSERILDFYKRPTPPARILEAGAVNASFAPKYHIPPAYDIITDNPVETRQDVVDTLELLYRMDRPYTLFIYALKVIPNTSLEQSMRELGVDVEEIDSSYFVIPPRVANLLLYVLAVFRPPRRMWDWLLRRVRASSEPQREYPRLGVVLRTMYLSKRVFDHMRRMDFSITPGWSGYVMWKLGIMGAWRRRFTAHLPRPARKTADERVAVTLRKGRPLLHQE
jgi:anaerobic magnesium-protoporphyrin IX monomethyl ester cyclase